MKLLFDQNLSPKLASRLDDLFSGSLHVRHVLMSKSNDVAIWEYARDNNFTIVTMDSDFSAISLMKGIPPKIIWLRCGNAPTAFFEQLLRQNHEIISDFIEDEAMACLELT